MKPVTVAALLCVACGPGPENAGLENDVRSPTIANGDYSFYEHKAVGHLSNGCSGVLIGKQTVLTAAHCGSQPQPLHFVEFHGAKYEAHDLLPHPQYSHPDHDVAIVRLKTPVTFITPLAMRTSPPTPNEPIEIVGFGDVDTGVGDFSVDMPRAGRNVVGQVWHDTFAYRYTPADGPQWGNGCGGDSGGAVLDQAGRVIGIHVGRSNSKWGWIFGGDSCNKNPGIAARVDRYHGWIMGHLGAGSFSGSGGSLFGSGSDCSFGGELGTCRANCFGLGAVWAIKGICSGGGVCCIGKPSCTVDRCGTPSPVPGSNPACYCDSLCTSNNDCCPGYEVCSGF
jgi:hypothetical protein